LDSLVKVDAPGPLLLDLGPDQKVQLGDSVTIKSAIINTTPIATTTWNFAPNCKTINGLCTEFTYLPLSSYRHQLILRDENGCEVSDLVVIEVIKDRLIFVPNIFRPESNDPDNFQLMVYGGKGVKKIRQWLIHDRWGSAVYDARDFLPNDANKVWDGKIKGEKATPGVYVWYLEAEFEDGVVEIFKGDVTLIR
jgi:CHU_C Type IX secretion signal domain